MKHDYDEREDGLVDCLRCGGVDSSLTTECPGRRMTAEEENAVHHGWLDYRFSGWLRSENK